MHYKIKNQGTTGVKSGIKKLETEAENEKTKKGEKGGSLFLKQIKVPYSFIVDFYFQFSIQSVEKNKYNEYSLFSLCFLFSEAIKL